MAYHANLIIVSPPECESRLLTAGFKPLGRSNMYTITLYRTYETPEIAVLDARALPPSCVWAIEPVPHA
jgi:hypothetical protein